MKWFLLLWIPPVASAAAWGAWTGEPAPAAWAFGTLVWVTMFGLLMREAKRMERGE